MHARVQEDVAPDVVAGKVDGNAQEGASAAVINRLMNIYIQAAVAVVHATLALKTFS